MLFNSIDFAIFLPVIFILYWLLNKDLKAQNILLLFASYYFYSCWSWKFLLLLIFSTSLDYFIGKKISASQNKKVRKILLWTCVSVSLGILGVFKYYNFFAASFSEALVYAGIHINTGTLDVILPIGISFYTFHGLSYIIDIYKNRIKAENSFVNYAVFVSFFPLLVAGPIERATHLLPQIHKARVFNYAAAVDGLRQILWGLFKKIVVADQCAVFVDQVFDPSANYSGSTHVVGIFVFAFQIYGDFSGYSDIAIGTAKLFGIKLMKNFSYPYFSRNIPEFWRRWHISLSSWFRDYVYEPLGGAKRGKWINARNTFILFLACGLWHGANWTFVVWGLLNAVYMLPAIFINSSRTRGIVAEGKSLPSFKELRCMLLTFSMASFAGIFFRCANLHEALQYIAPIFSSSLFTIPVLPLTTLLIIFVFLIIEWRGREDQYAIAGLWCLLPRPVRWGMYYALITFIFYFAGPEQQFLYFQF